jgi:hypothetical protein
MQTWQNRQDELNDIIWRFRDYLFEDEYDLFRARQRYIRRHSEDFDLIMRLIKQTVSEKMRAPKSVTTVWTPEATIIDKGGHKTEMRW